MLSTREFYASSVWGLRFGASGSAYTIVPGRHIGLDVRRTGDVPALLSGTVTAMILTSAMAWCVEVLTAGGVYLTYCHLANDNLPKVGARLAQGARVGRLASGPASLSLRDPEFPGTAWTGQHLHLVASRIPRAAWQLVKGRVLADFIDPTTIIAGVLASTAGDGSKPFLTKPKEWDEMASKEDIQAVVESVVRSIVSGAPDRTMDLFVIHGNPDATDPRNGVWLICNGKLTPLQQGSIDFLNVWSTTDGRSIASNMKTFATGGNPGAFDDLCRLTVLDFPKEEGDAASYYTPQEMSAAVVDELAKRLAG